MKTEISLEIIGEGANAQEKFYGNIITEVLGSGMRDAVIGKSARPKPWVAKITGTCPRFGLSREFVKYRKDYRNTSGTGNRGVRAFYMLESGNLYEVNEQKSWRRSERYFLAVNNDGDTIKMTKQEAIQWVTDNI